MIIISKKENIIFTQIKSLSLEYEEGIPESILKMELELYKQDLDDILEELTKKNLINYTNNKIKISTEANNEITIEEGIDADYENELNLNEKNSLKIIKSLVKDDKTISRYLLEGNLLYGELKLSNFIMYHVLLSLKNNNLIKMIKKNNGYYYQLLI
ncbi:MAG: hypothetical protein LBV42_06115 [Methanobrevibacter sp.]|jgi:hypothetical protein|nr:hypothetical protein [Methanobrevibacter sp.]